MRRIKKIAVLGSGTMGMGIAAQFANIGCDVLLLDIVPFNLSEDKKNNPKVRNSIADSALIQALKATKMHPFYINSFAKRIKTGNFDDDLHLIANCDWVIEVVTENLEIKKQLYDKVEKHRTPGTLLSSNTSGIPIHLMAEGRNDDFKQNFLGTHFFNPVRFMKLLEIIPTQQTSKEVIDFCMDFGSRMLGKETVLCKDTPGFIANRIGFFSGTEIMRLTDKYDLGIEEVDALVGPTIGRPKTGAFRLRDLVGVDVGPKVALDIIKNCPEDEYVKTLNSNFSFKHLDFLLEQNFLGNKTGQGFYKMINENGKRVIYALNLKTLTYDAPSIPDLPALKLASEIRSIDQRLGKLVDSEDKGGRFLNEYFAKLFSYASNRIPEISDTIYSVDNAMRTGYAWGQGPFQLWELIGLEKGIAMAEKHNVPIPNWIIEMVASGKTTFYKTENGKYKYYDLETKSYQVIPSKDLFVILDTFKEQSPVYKNEECSLHDIGDGVLCLEFTSRNNAIDSGIVQGLQEAIQIAEDGNWKGLVIGNNGKNFAVGANLKKIRDNILAKEWDIMNKRGRAFQEANLRLRYSKIPVVAAIHGFTLGGGCEISLHCDHVVAAAETYLGLVEVGVGLIPGAAGTKEMALRASNAYGIEDTKIPTLNKYFQNIAFASVSKSGYDAIELGMMRYCRDVAIANNDLIITKAKKKVLDVAENYMAPSYREDVTVLGRTGLSMLYATIESFKLGRYMSEYDVLIAKKIAWVMCGGDLTGEQQVSEQYLLDLEREAFMSLVSEPKTLERINYMLKFGKPLKN